MKPSRVVEQLPWYPSVRSCSGTDRKFSLWESRRLSSVFSIESSSEVDREAKTEEGTEVVGRRDLKVEGQEVEVRLVESVVTVGVVASAIVVSSPT